MLKDNFSKQADLYAKYRPTYPKDLYDFLYAHTSKFEAAWDCATGNGQVASVLSEKFETVYATDISENQLNSAVKKSNILYSMGSAENSGLEKPVDLITVAQAIHWFNVDKFYLEAQRLAKPGATLAYWGYGLIRINKEADNIIKHFYEDVVGPFWDPERALIENSYEDIHLPLVHTKIVRFQYQAEWTLEHLLGYLSSWSAVQKYIDAKGHNPADHLRGRLEEIFKGFQRVTFPIFLTLGHIK
ncbi:class I SAM-dependent methyltransferase [Fulvivirga sp. RKSG066]|uniref:class I SAM-dependent methyltransferase n=1 Tax=Fulvivirga aurantia TaxID=2529383 RepID=UPI0012BC5B5E|nr:class I SAM-dependent methyltransferase [Fulvivirga aurantia]MTI23311.1 class I SAM-dependent methyltransferase [Fulvivirga aurantia]